MKENNKPQPKLPRCCYESPPAPKPFIKDQIVEAVREDLLRRSQVGIKKYGVTLNRHDLGLRDWLQHAYEECLDQANYLKRAITKIDDEITLTSNNE